MFKLAVSYGPFLYVSLCSNTSNDLIFYFPIDINHSDVFNQNNMNCTNGGVTDFKIKTPLSNLWEGASFRESSLWRFEIKIFFLFIQKIHYLIVFTCHPCRSFFRRTFFNHHKQDTLKCKKALDSCEGPALRKCSKCRWTKCER